MVRGGYLIKTARTARGMSQEYIAEALNEREGKKTTVKTISRWETYQHEPRFCDVMYIIEDICKLSFADVEELINEEHSRCA